MTATERLVLILGTCVTNIVKLGGLAMGIHETMVRTELRPAALGVAAFGMAGAQGIENFLNRLLGR